MTVIVVCVCVTVVVTAAVLRGSPLTISWRDVKASIDRTETHVREVKEAVGEPNGNGNLSTMNARALAEMAELRAGLQAVNLRLDERTEVVRLGSTTPEPLADYTQERMHDVLNAVAKLSMQVQTLWMFLQEDYALPALSSMEETK